MDDDGRVQIESQRGGRRRIPRALPIHNDTGSRSVLPSPAQVVRMALETMTRERGRG